MAEFSTQQAATALDLLAEASSRRQEEFLKYDATTTRPDSDEESDSPSPVYDGAYRKDGSTGIHQMTNFNSPEFHKLWNRIAPEVLSKYNVGRGRKSKYSGKDVLFMTLVTLKHRGNWDWLGRMFDVKGPTFERMVTNFVKQFSETVYGIFVVDFEQHCTMKKLLDQGKTFKTFQYARYATDVTFQQSNRPTGNLQESKKYYSGKHKLYGYKVEVAVLPTGMAIGCTGHFPGSTSDLDIYYQNLFFHKRCLRKKDDEKSVLDTGDLVDKYPEHWATLMDKGYQGASEVSKAVHPVKKPRNGFLSLDQECKNKSVSSDRVIVENFFGRMCCLWGVLSQKYKWAEDLYDSLFYFCLGLTNVHVTLHPLRNDDTEFYHRYKNRLYSIGEQILAKRKKKQERYRDRRRRRLEMEFRLESYESTIEP